MNRRFQPEKRASQIVFDITGGDTSMKTMTLATIPKKEPIVRGRNDNFSLRTDDIDGAQPKVDTRPTRNLRMDVSDIQGTSPVPLYRPGSKPIDWMSVSDIDGAQPRICRNMPHSHRHTNPLNPQYELSQKKEDPPPELPFRYDPLKIDDIPGVRPRTYKSDKPPRDIMNVSDITGTRSKQRTMRFDPQNRILDVSDINKDGQFHTRRVTDPLNPVYDYDGQQKADYGMSHSNYLSRRGGAVDLSLKTKDIDGATADSSTKWYREFRNTPITQPEGTELATTLMIPGMVKQTAELERRKAIDRMRGEKIRRFENRHLQREQDHQDEVQAMLRQQRAANKRRSTFENPPITL